MTLMRSGAKNMCSVRQSPMPSAPRRTAVSASSGVSALARTKSLRVRSAQPRNLPKFPPSSARIVGIFPRKTSPVAPSMVSSSPSLSQTMRHYPPDETRCDSQLHRRLGRDIQRRTVGPYPRATTAAWEVIPPVAVGIPRAACMPWMSSGLVSFSDQNDVRAIFACSAASSGSMTGRPVAAPGDALRPRASNVFAAFGSSWGCSSCEICSGSTRIRAVPSSMRSSSTKSTAILSAAPAVRFAFLVCKMKSCSSWTVNSTSWMSV